MSDDQELTKLPQELIDRIAKDLSQWDDVAAEQHGDAGLQPWGPNSMSAIVKRVLTKAAKDPRKLTKEDLLKFGIGVRDKENE